MALPQSRSNDHAGVAAEKDLHVDLEQEARIRIGCPLCGAGGARLVCSVEDIEAQRAFLQRFYRSRWRAKSQATAADRVTFTQNYPTSIVACADCGLLYRNPRPLPEAITQAYKTDHYDGAYLWAEFEVQRTWARTKIPVLAKHLPESATRTRPRVLEIGSFVGGFLAEGSAQGWDMFGIDPGQDVTAFCRGQMLPVFQGTLEDAKLSPASFDAIVVWNTFDQLPNPHVLLKSAVPLLRNGGLLVVRVPNGACFDYAMTLRSNVLGRLREALYAALAWNNLLTFPYLHGYSAVQLVQLMAHYGFRLRACLPDQLTSTPAGHLKWWATIEEHCVKTLHRAGSLVWRDGGGNRFYSAPWLDLYFERAFPRNIALGRWDAGLGLLPVYASVLFGQTKFNCRRLQEDWEGGLR